MKRQKQGRNPQSTPQEIEVWYILPAVRKELAGELLKLGKKQKEISLLLGTTESAVSQYLSKKRGAVAQFSKHIHKKIKACARKITKSNIRTARLECLKAIQDICSLIRKEGCLCKVHKRMGAVKTCRICR